ncbi:threonine/homoserine/homoserine lactone efflux protein [Aliiruegeria haliotis]|uniref:Threonine/homoserine/homoserine lactone efflux protein n=1 Tax=Aliiruegeria haliotis TaxID=1280846 RepID=A0A2T0RGQ0_9RHOB|nr:LysE family translocator [Aliiruegeria haliotis]PRY20280.1 threonine/homoserine/homoserine lactone efflux protein [Aliiruegeria haliotis]
MIPSDILMAFAATTALLAMAPGPDNIFVLTQSALHGRRAGLAVTMGLCTGVLVHTLLVAFGVAAVLQASPAAFTALKTAGVAYLLYLAWGAFRAGSAILSAQGNGRVSPAKLYLLGVVMNLTNPKVAIFFLAFLPQFVDPAAGNVVKQLGLLGVVFVCMTLLVFGAVALTAGSLGSFLRRSVMAQTVLNRVAGTVFLALALSLALAER